MTIEELQAACATHGFVLRHRSEHHFQVCEPDVMATVLVDVWPGTGKFLRHKAPAGKKAAIGNALSVVTAAEHARPKRTGAEIVGDSCCQAPARVETHSAPTEQDIVIERLPEGGFNVRVGDRDTQQLTFDEMLGIVASLAMPPDMRMRHSAWLRTEAEREEYRQRQELRRRANQGMSSLL